MPEIPAIFPPQNPRVEFMTKHRFDLELWTVMPVNLGVALAPLYDHLSPQLWTVVIALAIVAVNPLWIWWARPQIENRIGVSRPNAFANRNFKRRPWALTVSVWVTYLVVVAIIVFLNRNQHFYRATGWMEKTSGTWLCMMMVFCLYRAFDRTNYRPRRLWYGMAAFVLAVDFYFLYSSPSFFAVTLVLIGTIGIVLGLFDLGLLFHFASIPADDSDGINIGILKEEDMHG